MEQPGTPDALALAELRESEERFRATAEMAAIGIAQVTAEGRFLFANRFLCELLGYSSKELQGLQFSEVSHPDDRLVTEKVRRQLWLGEVKSFQVEKRYLHKDGSIVWCRLSVALKRRPTGEPQFDIAVFEDITERKRSDQYLRLEHSVTLCLAEAETAVGAVRAIIQVLCENLGWSAGEYWGVDEQARVLRFGGYWDNLSPELRHIFRQAHEHDFVFPPGVGLAGAVWQRAEPMWVADVSTDERMLRKELAHEAGLRGAFLFPVATSDHVLGVFSFWSRAIREPDVRMLDAIRVIGSQIGQFLRRKQAEERTQFLATHDGLTRLPNRETFRELLNVSIETARRYGRQFAVLFIDLDRFKQVNDTLGHGAGDQLLCEIAKRLKDSLRASDIVARLGGDEFVVLLQEVVDAEEASEVARKILAAIAEPVHIDGKACDVTGSIGIAIYPADAEDEHSLMKNADAAMYQAKDKGRNNFQFYEAVTR